LPNLLKKQKNGGAAKIVVSAAAAVATDIGTGTVVVGIFLTC
jgi:hypothetical protein